jgi:23S rRNA pseudouridine2457 synthase
MGQTIVICRMEFRYFVMYKPYMVLSQFSDPVGGKATLGDIYPFPKDVYPVGRLDEDSEGLLLLTNNPKANALLLGQNVEKEYWVQVEGVPDTTALAHLRRGVPLRINKKAFTTAPAKASLIEPAPTLPPRNPPIRVRASIPDSWISITIKEGKNRQVRRMTAAVGFPTLRLVRVRMGNLRIEGLQSGEVREVSAKDFGL